MGTIEFIVDQVLLALNVIVAVMCVLAPINAYQRFRTGYAVWEPSHQLLPRLLACVGASIVAGLMIGIAWAGWRLAGFPTWGRWLFG